MSHVENSKFDNEDIEFQKVAGLSSSEVSEMLTNRLVLKNHPTSPILNKNRIANNSFLTTMVNQNVVMTTQGQLRQSYDKISQNR